MQRFWGEMLVERTVTKKATTFRDRCPKFIKICIPLYYAVLLFISNLSCNLTAFQLFDIHVLNLFRERVFLY